MFENRWRHLQSTTGETERPAPARPRLQDDPPAGAADFSARARALARFAFFGEALGDAPWALMLEIFCARLDGHRLTPAEVAAAVAIGPQTAADWLDWLEKRNLIARYAEGDHSAETVHLTEWAADAVHAYLAAAAPPLPASRSPAAIR